MKMLVIIIFVAFAAVGCATLTEDAMTPIAFSFSDGSNGECKLQNKRGEWEIKVPSTVYVRRSGDALKYNCQTEDGRTAVGTIPSKINSKAKYILGVFLYYGIVDDMTDKDRKYMPNFVIPIMKSTTTR